jgi:thiol:disulfide interchange protein
MNKTAVCKYGYWLLIFCCVACGAKAQDAPVQWRADLDRLNDSMYSIRITGTVKAGWYVYATADDRYGLEPVSIGWNDPRIRVVAPVAPQQETLFVPDKIFNTRLPIYAGTIAFEQRVKISGPITSARISITGYAAKEKIFLPLETTLDVQFDSGAAKAEVNPLKRTAIDIQHPLADCGMQPERGTGLMALFLLGIGGGLLALLTPCVFPMIPLTIAYFAKSKAPGNRIDKNGLLYGFFILVIYLAESLPFHVMGNIDPAIFNRISTSVGLNLFFFVVFILFALSLFGLFEIRMPFCLSARTGTRSNLRTRSGIFFMAMTLAIVSFSCTGPILGALLAGAITSDGGAWQLTAGMGGFGLGLGVPFVLFACFPQWLQHLPKSGGWLETVKKALAFVELALAFKFLSNADLVSHWGLLRREVFILIWILIFSGLTLYLIKRFSTARIIAGSISFLFVLYLCMGLTQGSYARLSLLSGFPPPMEYSFYQHSNDHTIPVADVVNDYEKAIALAKKEKKPVLIDFTGWACVNCRKMEENVWAQPEVAALIKDRFILVSLYVDDRAALPTPLWYLDSTSTKEVNTAGDQWAAFEATNFHQVSQPLYAIISPAEQLLNKPCGYQTDVAAYWDWLQCGLKACGPP